jgi:phenylacetate-CoA ligase
LRNFLKSFLSLNGFPINEGKEFISSLDGVALQERELLQYKRALNNFNYHFQNNKYYRSFCESRGFVFKDGFDWNEIPILTKKDIQRPLEEILSVESTRGLYYHNTSGSSGTPFVFAKNKKSHAKALALYLNRLQRLGIDYGTDLQARFYGIPKKGISHYKERIKDRLAGRIRFPVFDLTDDRLNEILKSFAKNQFVYINGYTNSILLFANFLIRKNILLKDICPSLQCVIPTSEVCTSTHRELMEKAFGVEVFVEYGAAELDIIAMEDLTHDFIVNNETLWVEILDENDNPVNPGEVGRVVVTSLFNEAMPFIRYDLGDRVKLGTNTTPTHRAIDYVEGRVNDNIILPSGKISPGLTFYYIVKVLFEGKPNIKEFVIHQTKINTFEFQYVAEYEVSDLDKSKINTEIERYLESGLNVQFIKKEILERHASGKLKTFVSHLN